MKKYWFLMGLILSQQGIFGQETGHSLYMHGGYNNHSYTQNHPGWYLNIGADMNIWKNLKLGIVTGYSKSDNFPSRIKVYSLQLEDENAILQSFIGISQQEWIEDAKGIYRSIQATRLGLIASFDFIIKKKIQLAPRVGFNLISMQDVSLGIFEASFSNDRLVDGVIGYDFRKGNLLAVSVGLRMGYIISKRVSVFVSVEDIRDLNGDGFVYYEAKNAGVGIQYWFVGK